jgi:hydroxymethylbilane synthase
VTLRLGTRGSRLALVQCETVANALRARGVDVEMQLIKTSGDRLAQVALADFGGKALFVREIEEALFDGRIDVGVHSLKDVPGELPDGLCLAAFPPREDPRDVLVTRAGGTLGELAKGAAVGTSSLRRRVQLLAGRPDLRVEPIRGNVETWLAKLESGTYDAIVLARAGLKRLALTPVHALGLSVEEFLPAVGQGTLALEVRARDRRSAELLSPLDDARTRTEAEAERAFLHRLGAGCHTPVAGHARRDGETLHVTGLVASPDGATILRASISGLAATSETLGQKLADELLARGARRLLTSCEAEPA